MTILARVRRPKPAFCYRSRETAMALNALYTIGYSAYYNPEDFLEALKRNGITALVDVRAQPEIASFAHYKGQSLKAALNAAGIHYLSFAEEFGARPLSDEFYTDGVADFAKIAASPAFKKGCERIRAGLERFAICLMCAEKDPAACHRSILITHEIEKIYPEIAIKHILPDRLLAQKDIDDTLRERYKILPGSLDACYKMYGRSIGWRKGAKKGPA